MDNWRSRSYGKISGGELEQILSMFDVAWAERGEWPSHEIGSEEWAKAVAKLTAVPSWVPLYKEPLAMLLARLVSIAGMGEAFVEVAKSDHPTQRFLDLAEDLPDEPPDHPDAIAVAFALVGNLDAIANYSRTINEMLSAGERGDVDALFQALSIDSSLSTMPFFQAMLRLGQLGNSATAAEMVFRAIRGPHRKRNEYPKLRWLEYLLRDQGAFQACTREEIYELCVEHLRVYDPDGTKKDSKAGLFSRFSNWQKEAGIQNPRFGFSAARN